MLAWRHRRTCTARAAAVARVAPAESAADPDESVYHPEITWSRQDIAERVRGVIVGDGEGVFGCKAVIERKQGRPRLGSQPATIGGREYRDRRLPIRQP